MLDPHLIETLADRTFTAESFIKEFIMNSYEADAERVEITIYNNGEVVIEDSGKYAGMTEEDINAFLTIATRYKTKKRFTKHYKRPIAGEMGIGRLSFFKAFNVLEVETEKDGRRLRFSLSEPLFNEVARKGRVSVDIDEEPPTGKNGTKLRFMGLKDKEYQVTPEQVRRIIESQFRFLLIKTRGPFKIFVNGVEVKPRRLPSGARKIVIDRVVEGVDIKGFKAVDSKITGFIILLKEKEKDPAFRGMQLYIRGSPIGPRRSLGEFLGDKILDSVIPFDKVTGEIEAPFLRPSASRQWVDVNHISFIKFKEVMGEIAEEILEEIRQQRETKIKKLKNPSLDSARKCLEKALRYEPDLWRKGGLVSMGAYDPSDKKVTDATTPLTKLKRLLSFGSRKGAREKKKADEPRKPRTVRHVHVGSCLLYTSPSPRDLSTPRMPSSA